MDGFKERVRDANPIERIIGEYATIKETGGRLTCLCPLHDEKTPSMHIYPATQSFYCFGCGAGGSVFDFIMHKESLDFIGALNLLAEKARIEPPKWTPEQKAAAEKKRTEHERLSQEIETYHKALLPNQEPYQAILDRGITAETIERYKIGWDAQAQRVIIPAFKHGQPVYLIGWLRSQKPKYLFPDGQQKPVVGAEYLRQDNCLIVEGIFDWLSLIQAGFPAACLLGSNASESQLKELMRSQSPIIAFDGDEPGRIAAEKLAEQLFPNGRIAHLDAEADINDLLVQLGREMFETKVKKLVRESRPLIDIRIGNLENLSADDKAKHTREQIFPLVAKQSPLQQEASLIQLKKACGFRVSVLRQELKTFLEDEDSPSAASEASAASVASERAALFPSLIEIVKTDNGLMFWTKDGLNDNYFDGEKTLVPPVEPTLVQMPSDRALGLVGSYNDAALFADLVKFLYDHIDLEDERGYKILAAWVLHTWLLEQAEDSPIIHVYGPKGSGKSTLIETAGAVARRSIPTVTLTGPALFRVNALYAPTLLIDEISLAKNPDVQDMLKARFSRGMKVIRVNMDKSGLDQIDSFEVYGATVLGGTQDVPGAIRSRTVRFYMERACRPIRRTLDKHTADNLIDTLAAFRARHLESELATPEPIVRDGRLSDVVYPLHQIILLVSPGDEQEFVEFCKGLEKERAEEDSLSMDALVVKAVRACQPQVGGNKLAIKPVAEYLNKGRPENEQLKEQSVGKVMSRLGFKVARTSSGHGARYWDSKKLERLEQRYDLKEDPSEQDADLQSDATDATDAADASEAGNDPLEKTFDGVKPDVDLSEFEEVGV